MRNIRKYTSLLILSTLTFIFPTARSVSADSSEVRERTPVELSEPQRASTEWKKVKIILTPTVDYWDKVAQCETANDWKNGGQWAGGLGIYTKGEFGSSSMGTWEYYGGEEFAPSPNKATKEEQIKVANRIAVLGYKTKVYRDPDWARRAGVPVTYIHDKKPVGFSGWGCVKSKSTGEWRIGLPKKWTKYAYVNLPTNPSMYCKQWEHLFADYQLPVKVFSYIAWRESRCQANVIGWNFKPGMSKHGCETMTPSCDALSSYDSGILQINSTWKTVTSNVCKTVRGDMSVLKDPHCNVKVAKYLYDREPKRFHSWRIKLYTEG